MMKRAAREQRLALAIAQLDAGEHIQATPTLEALRDQVLPEMAALSEDDERLRTRVLLALARAYPRQGRSQDAVRAGCEAALWFEQLGDAAGACDAHTLLALAYAQLGVGRESLDQALRSLELARHLQDREREAWALLRVGNAHAALDNPAQAREITQQAREIAQQLQLAELDFACVNNQAGFTLDELEFARFDGDNGRSVVAQAMAELLAQQSLDAAKASGNPYRQALALSHLIEALLHGSEWDRVQAHIDALMQLADRHGYTGLRHSAQLQQAKLTAAQGGWQVAIAQAQKLQHEAAGQLLPRQRKSLLQLLYECHKAWGDADRALAFLEEMVRLERQTVRDTQMVQTQLLLIRDEVHQAVGRAERAVAAAQAAQQRNAALEAEALRLQAQLVDTDRAAREDALTGLANRRHAEQALLTCVEMARRLQQPLALAMLDLDHFKQVNDRFGHATGDAVLRELGSLLKTALPAGALAARWGGEEFLLVLPNTAFEACKPVLERLRAAVQAHAWANVAEGLAVTASIGASLSASTDEGWEPALARADAALYAAKAAGRNCVIVRA